MKKIMRTIFPGILLLSAMSSFAQTNLYNSGVLSVTSATDTLYIGGSFTNDNTASLTNSGKLVLTGDLTNNQSAITIGTGTLFFNGTSLQTVGGAQPFKTYHLVTNNAAGIVLNMDLSVSGIHSFAAGIITTSSTPNYLVYEAGSSYTGDADARHVNGWIKKIGSTDFIFPLGDASVERTIALTNLTITGEFNVKYLTSTPNTTLIQQPLVNVDGVEYWSINKITGGNALVAMNWDNSKVGFPHWILSQISASRFSGTAWIDLGGTATGNTTTTGNVTSTSVSSFGLFTFGSKAFPIPVTLISFSATRSNGVTKINWSTVSEHNVSRFVVERSDNGSSFNGIGQSAARNSGNVENYALNDPAAINNVAYYRLRSIDIDGREKLSKVVAVVETSAGQIKLLSNPAHDHLVIAAGKTVNGNYNYEISNMQGQLVQQGRLQIENGGQYDILLKPAVNSGAYVLRMQEGVNEFTFRIVVY
jgi:hypothetical protein